MPTDTTAPDNHMPETIIVHRCDAEAIAYILFRLEDVLRNGDEQIAQDVSEYLTNASLDWTADWVAELACYVDRQLSIANLSGASNIRP